MNNDESGELVGAGWSQTSFRTENSGDACMRQFIHMPNMLNPPAFGPEDKCTKDKAGKSTSGLDHPTQVYSLKVDFSDPSWPDHSKVLCDAAIGVKRCHLLK